MKLPFAVIIAATYGLLIRIVFGLMGAAMEVMSLSFLFFAPFIIGFITIILLPLEKIKNRVKAFFIPWLTTAAVLVITMALFMEGAVCWIMIYPFFSVLSGLGGIVAYTYKLRQAKKSNDHPNFNLSFLALLPLVIGFIEKDAASASKEYHVSKTIIMNASPAQVWDKLTHIDNIALAENRSYLTDVIGFPRHIKTVIDKQAVGGHRMAVFEKGLYFDETITSYLPQKQLTLAIKTDPDKIPPTVLDEHIVIGGKHINIIEDKYEIEPLANGKCSLKLSSRFTICTPFNWYAIFWANLTIDNILQSELNLIKARVAMPKTAQVILNQSVK
ncbi:MAG: SRPBCC family protein [Bacteroidota bacterium]